MQHFNDQISDGQYRAMEQSWLSDVQGEREKEGMEHPADTKCNCGKSRTSYPHRPPSCHSEAVDQLRCLLGRSYPHRQYLAHCWLTSLFRKLALEGTEEIATMITLVQKNCPALQSAGELPDLWRSAAVLATTEDFSRRHTGWQDKDSRAGNRTEGNRTPLHQPRSRRQSCRKIAEQSKAQQPSGTKRKYATAQKEWTVRSVSFVFSRFPPPPFGPRELTELACRRGVMPR
ncbi:hypothetical protein V8E54_014107, partial [Elaphomyces granulatus]